MRGNRHSLARDGSERGPRRTALGKWIQVGTPLWREHTLRRLREALLMGCLGLLGRLIGGIALIIIATALLRS